MRKFILLIRRFWNLILFLALEITAFVLIAKNRNLQGMDLISSSNSIAGYLYQKQSDILYYFQLKRLNDSLLAENTRLNNALGQLTFVDTFQSQTAYIPISHVNDSSQTAVSPTEVTTRIESSGTPVVVRYQKYKYLPARVIKNSVSNDRMNFITLNRGKKSGIKKGMAVVTGSGIVGRVAVVSEHYATVTSILSNRKVSARLADSTFNFISWPAGNPRRVEMQNVPITVATHIGDPVFTTGYSYFPGNILIGKIIHIDSMPDRNTKTLTIRLSTNFRNLQYVYVVKDQLGIEKHKLKQHTEETIK